MKQIDLGYEQNNIREVISDLKRRRSGFCYIDLHLLPILASNHEVISRLHLYDSNLVHTAPAFCNSQPRSITT
jgi:hypothetical protein